MLTNLVLLSLFAVLLIQVNLILTRRKLNKKIDKEFENVFHVLKKYKDRLDIYEKGLYDGLKQTEELLCHQPNSKSSKKSSKSAGHKTKGSASRTTRKKVGSR